MKQWQAERGSRVARVAKPHPSADPPSRWAYTVTIALAFDETAQRRHLIAQTNFTDWNEVDRNARLTFSTRAMDDEQTRNVLPNLVRQHDRATVERLVYAREVGRLRISECCKTRRCSSHPLDQPRPTLLQVAQTQLQPVNLCLCCGLLIAMLIASTTLAHEHAVGGQQMTGRMKKGCGWTYCYLKFNRTETNRIAAGAGLGAAVLPPPFDAVSGLTAALAGHVSSQGQCVMLSYSPLVSMTRITPGAYRCR